MHIKLKKMRSSYFTKLISQNTVVIIAHNDTFLIFVKRI
jgi:hypothetical protein